MSDTPARRIALFIDFENLVTNTGITPSSFDIQPSLDRLLEKGKVIFRRAYCDWSRFREAKGHLHDHGVELVEVPPSTRAGKNSADMRLVIDALELCYAREHIDTFVIASGDSDFVPLASKLRENDKYVIGIGVKKSTSPIFVKACDEFIYLRPENERPARAEKEKPERKHAEKPEKTDKHEKADKSEKPEKHAKSEGKKRELPAIARQVLSNLLSRATGPLNPSFIKETIVRKEPDFDERDHGFSSFSRLLEAAEKEGLCSRVQQGRQWYVVAKEGARAEASEDEAVEHVESEEHIPDPEE
ncbi:MAG: NYN domain-containing protein [Archangium sp.]